MVDKNSIRFGTNKGIRFAAVVDNKIRYNDKTQEIGFLVTRRTLLEANGETAEDLKVYIDPELGEPYLDEDKDGIRGIGPRKRTHALSTERSMTATENSISCMTVQAAYC